MLLKLFKLYFEETEWKWLKIISNLKSTINSLKIDRDLLLSKYKQIPSDTKSIIDNNLLND